MENINLGWLFLILLGGILAFVFFGQSILKLVKLSWYGIIHIAIGAVFIFLFNLLGQLISFQIPLNIITAIVVGLLGLPGLLTLTVVKILFI